MPRTRKITMTVFCLEEDAADVKRDLFDDSNSDCWFFGSDFPLTNIKVDISEPTAEENEQAVEELDVEGLDVE